MENLVKRALRSQPEIKPMKGMVYLKTLAKGAKFSLHNKTGTVIHTTPESVYIELDSHFSSADGNYYVSKHKTQWAGLTQVRRES